MGPELVLHENQGWYRVRSTQLPPVLAPTKRSAVKEARSWAQHILKLCDEWDAKHPDHDAGNGQ